MDYQTILDLYDITGQIKKATMRIAVITSNFGNFDLIRTIPKQSIEYDRFYFTEENSPYPAHTIDNRLKAKIFKIMPHLFLPDYDIYIWVDANVQIKSDKFVAYLSEELLNDKSVIDFIISPHPHRDNIYDEAGFIIDSIKKGSKYLRARYSAESIEKEIDHIGPGLKGLYYCGIFARKNDPIVNQMCENWFMDNILWTNFDQINFVANLYKYHLTVYRINFGDFYNNDFYNLNKHLVLA